MNTEPTHVESDDPPAPAFPVIHLNGTGYDTLMREYTELLRSANALGKQLSDTTFHARDYYPVEGSWEKAVTAREEIWSHLKSIEKYAEEHMAAIYEQKR
jgi:hypothetical protein